MYGAIVAGRVRSVWKRMSEGDVDAPVRMAAATMSFRFVGDTQISAQFTGPAAFRSWLEGVFRLFPGVRFEVRDVIVAGWPWNTRVAVRLGIDATLADGSPYRNEAVQWIRLRWGKLIDDWVLEDTATLNRAIDRQAASRGAVS